MNDLNRKKKRLRMSMFAAAAIGCSSATVSGTLAVLGATVPPPLALAPAAEA